MGNFPVVLVPVVYMLGGGGEAVPITIDASQVVSGVFAAARLAPGGAENYVLRLTAALTLEWAASSGTGLPAGGSAGQFLVKQSGVAGDAAWEEKVLGEARHIIEDAEGVGYANRTRLRLFGANIVDHPEVPATYVQPRADGDSLVEVQAPGDAPVGGTWRPTVAEHLIAVATLGGAAPATLMIQAPTDLIGTSSGVLLKVVRVVNTLAGVVTVTFDPAGFVLPGSYVAPKKYVVPGGTRDWIIWHNGTSWLYGVEPALGQAVLIATINADPNPVTAALYAGKTIVASTGVGFSMTFSSLSGFSPGESCIIRNRCTSGNVTIVNGGGITLNVAAGVSLAIPQYGAAQVFCAAANVYDVTRV